MVEVNEKNVLHSNIKILHQEVQQPPQQQPSSVKDKSEAPRLKHAIHPSCAVYSCQRLKFIPACTGREAGQVYHRVMYCVTISNHSQTTLDYSASSGWDKAFPPLIWPFCATAHSQRAPKRWKSTGDRKKRYKRAQWPNSIMEGKRDSFICGRRLGL